MSFFSFYFLVFTFGLCHGQSDKAALLVGGYRFPHGITDGGYRRKEVELFGCRLPDGRLAESIPVADFPYTVWYPGGIWRNDVERAMICGGYQCNLDGTGCGESERCLEWDPKTNQWSSGVNMKSSRWNFYTTKIGNPNVAGGEVPLILGDFSGKSMSEIFTGTEWQDYKDLAEVSPNLWTKSQCMAEVDGIMYHSGIAKFESVNLAQWTSEIDAELPEYLTQPRRCATVDVGGRKGLMTMYGYWYDIEADQWKECEPLPGGNLVELANNLFSFNGIPTNFGTARCNAGGECDSIEVHQYDSSRNTWDYIGDMAYQRDWHEMVEVPISICDNFELKPMPNTSGSGAKTLTISATLLLFVAFVKAL